ncbi:MAG: hypothetical protein R3B72_43380 [Polyangiaceae bacterium]
MPPPGGGMPPPGGGMPPPGGGMPPPGGGMPPPGGGMPPPGGGMGGYPPGPYGGPGAPAGAMPGGYGPVGPGGYGGPPGGPPPKKGKGLLVLGILGGLLVVGGIVVAMVMLLGGGSRQVSKAYAHLPEGCDAVIHVDVKGLLAVPSVKEHLLPALDKKAKESEDASKGARFLLTAGLDPRKDITGVAVCLDNISPTGAPPDFVVVMGGDLVEGGILDALDKHGDPTKYKKSVDKDGLRVVEYTEDDVVITQAPDAALVLASSMALLKKGVGTSKAYKDVYDLPLGSHVAGIVTQSTVQSLATIASATGGPFGSELNGAGRIELSANLDSGKVRAELDLASASEAEALVKTLRELRKGIDSVPGVDPEISKIVAESKIVSQEKKLIVQLTIPKQLIDQGVKELAKQIESADDEI